MDLVHGMHRCKGIVVTTSSWCQNSYGQYVNTCFRCHSRSIATDLSSVGSSTQWLCGTVQTGQEALKKRKVWAFCFLHHTIRLCAHPFPSCPYAQDELRQKAKRKTLYFNGSALSSTQSAKQFRYASVTNISFATFASFKSSVSPYSSHLLPARMCMRGSPPLSIRAFLVISNVMSSSVNRAILHP